VRCLSGFDSWPPPTDRASGISVATKHHLRGEMTIYYEDLYPLVQPLHQHPRRAHGVPTKEELEKRPSLLMSVKQTIGSAFWRKKPAPTDVLTASPAASTTPLPPQSGVTSPHVAIQVDVTSPQASGSGAYGTFSDQGTPKATRAQLHPTTSESSLASTSSSDSYDDDTTPLLPSALSEAERRKLPNIKTDLIAFSSFVGMLAPNRNEGGHHQPTSGPSQQDAPPTPATFIGGLDHDEHDTFVLHADRKHRPRIPGGGENIPLQIIWVIDDWLALCEKRGTVPGTSLGGMIGTISAMEDALGQLEKILMTPLPL